MKIVFGMARKCINPEVPISLAGYFNRRMWDHVLDDIEVRALVLKDAKGHVAAFVNFDMLFVTHDLEKAVWEEAKKRKIKLLSEENTILSATHVHTAPEIRSNRQGGNVKFFSMLVDRAVSAMEEALTNLKKSPRKGELESTVTRDTRFIFNRRYWMKDGTVVTNPGKLNRNIVRPEGEIDPEIPLFAVREEDGNLSVIVSSIVNHTDTIGGTGVSADWAGVYRRTMEKFMLHARKKGKKECMLIPLIGAEGNINHFDVSSPRCQTCYDEAKRVGKGYAETVTKALENLKKVEGNELETVHTRIGAKVREIDEAELAEARKIIAKYPDIDVNDPEAVKDLTSEDLAKGTPFALKFFAANFVALAGKHDKQDFPLTGIRLGSDLVIASLPSEPFTEIGLAVRKQIFGGKTCLVAALSGTGSTRCGAGYIPNAWNYGRGGYETTPRSNPYSMKTGASLVAGWTRLAKKFHF